MLWQRFSKRKTCKCRRSCWYDSSTINWRTRYTINNENFSRWITANPPKERTGKTIAVIGSGPAGLAAAQQLNRAGHKVKVFERDSVVGGLLSLGIPEFKLEKWVVKRRIDLLEKEGIEFFTNVNVGVDYKVEDLDKDFDAVCLAGGSTIPRNLEVEGRDLNGIHYAMEYLTQQNKNHKGLSKEEIIDARGKHVVILGGGDTGADCLGTATRQGAASVTQLELIFSVHAASHGAGQILPVNSGKLLVA